MAKKRKTVDKICERCGLVMLDVDPIRRYCPECRPIVQKENSAASRKKRKQSDRELAKARKAEETEAAKKIPPKPPIKTINQVVREARLAHMSYGQYVARMREGR